MQKTSITLVDKELRVRFPFNPIMVNMIRLLDPRRKWRPETKEWAFPAEGPILERLCDAFGVDRYALADDLKALIKLVTLPPPVDLSLVDGHVFLTQPYKHQKRGLAELLAHDRWGLWWEAGTGKSHIGANRLKDITGKSLILCPKSLLGVWREQLLQHAGLACKLITEKDRETGNILVCNYDALASKRNTFIFDIDWEVVIADEVQFLKNSTAQRSKLARRAAQCAKYRWALSGTPAPNSPLDFFGVLLFIDQETAGTTSKTAFAARYAIMQDIPGGGKMVAGYRDLGDLNRRVASVSSRLTKEECLDLPEKVFVERRCVLTGEQLRVYKDLKDKAVARLNQQKEESTLSVRNILTESLRLLQCVGGFLPSDEGVVHALVPGAKMELLGDVLEEVGPKKLVLWCSFLEELHAVERLLGTLGRKVVTFHGDVPSADRERAVEEFQRGGADVFLATPQTGGVGLTLTAADTEVFYSRTWSLTHWLQATDRLHRIGQVNKVTVISLVAEGTVDEKVAEALARKEQTQEYLMRRPVEDIFGGGSGPVVFRGGKSKDFLGVADADSESLVEVGKDTHVVKNGFFCRDCDGCGCKSCKFTGQEEVRKGKSL